MAPTLRPTAGPSRTTPGRYNEDMEQLIFRMHQMLIDELDADQISAMPADERRKVVEQAAETLLRREMPGVGGITRDQIVSRVVDEVVGLGPIDALMRDPSISEVMVNRPDEVYFVTISTFSVSLSASSRRSDGGSMSLRRWWTPVFRTARVSTS